MKNYTFIFNTQACEVTLAVLNIVPQYPKTTDLTPTGRDSLNAVHGAVWAIL